MVQYEYEVISIEQRGRLNELGLDGYFMVGTTGTLIFLQREKPKETVPDTNINIQIRPEDLRVEGNFENTLKSAHFRMAMTNFISDYLIKRQIRDQKQGTGPKVEGESPFLGGDEKEESRVVSPLGSSEALDDEESGETGYI